ncbi:MAG: RHS repeat-associated core domain-containing protein [Acidobacteriota bacterium]
MRKIFRMMTLLFLVLPGAAGAQGPVDDFPSHRRGLPENTPFAVGDIDRVNAQSGNLVLTLPLGQQFPTGGGRSYGLQLLYNSNAWDWDPEFCRTSEGDVDLHIAYPARQSNAGIGWSVSLGRLFEPNQAPFNRFGNRWIYAGPDGGRQGFYDSLHPDLGQPQISFTNDGSYIRMRSSGACHTAPTGPYAADCEIELDFPDGVTQRFVNQGTPAEPDWRPVQFRDPFGEFLTVDYSAANHRWVLNDTRHHRTQEVLFDPLAPPGSRIREVKLSWIDGTVSYSFEYAESVSVPRHRYAEMRQRLNCAALTSEDPPLSVDVDLLTAVHQPDGSRLVMTYHTGDDGAGPRKSGAIESLRLPTGATYTWEYGRYEFLFSKPVGDPQYPLDDYAPNFNFGVRRKAVTGRLGQSLGEWTYQPSWSEWEAPMDREPGDHTDLDFQPCHYQTTITDPVGNRTVHYFMAAEDGQYYKRGLPYTQCDPHAQGEFQADPPYLSTETYAPGAATPTRSVWLDYDSDRQGSGSEFERDHRVRWRRTVYHDDGEHFVESRYSDYDGLGHFRREVRDSDFPIGESRKTIVTQYNPDRGTLGGSPAFTLPAPGDPWILDTYSERNVTAGGSRERSLFCFDPATGFLAGRRILKAAAEGAGDLLVRWVPDAHGNRIREVHYGGDDQGLNTGCGAAAAPAHGPYVVAHDYDYGSLARSRYLSCDPAATGCSAQTVLLIEDHTVDPSTGKVVKSRDAAGHETEFVYDRMNRLIHEKPQANGWAWTVHTYDLADLEYRVRTCVHGSTNCTGAATLTRSILAYDELGRPVEERRRLPAGFAVRRFAHDPAGQLLSTSEWGSDGPSGFVTRFEDYDSLGRPARVVRPDDSVIRFTYFGDRRVDQTVDVHTASGSQESHRQEIRDGLGRLVLVREPAGEGGAPVTTTYAYDRGDRLTRVCIDDADDDPGNPCTGQERSFTYDRRGFISSETHPELGTGSPGTLRYPAYDPLGNVLAVDPPGSPWNLEYRYDRAGRLTQVEQVEGASRSLWKEYFYARGNGACAGLCAGKLHQTKRHNRIAQAADPGLVDDVVVTETLHYGQAGGRLSKYSVRASDGPTFEAEVVGYDPLGNVTALRYPTCDRPPCEDVVAAPTVAFGFNRGFLTAIPGFADEIRYHPTGLLASLTHANGVTDHHELSATAWSPLHRIRTSGVSGGDWTYGPFHYDGAGNIHRIDTSNGVERYSYDLAGRLTESRVATSTGTRDQDFRYDAYGNLRAITTDGSVRSIGVDGRNRLTVAEGAVFDPRGNLTALDIGGLAYAYRYDPFDQLSRLTLAGGGADRSYLYTVDDERVAVLDLESGAQTWTPRGPGNQVLSRFRQSAGGWSRLKNYIHAGDRQVAAEQAGGETRHFHLDHLGTTRLITDEAGARVTLNTYYPFGGYTEIPAAGAEELQFTGHERDANGPVEGDLDYMHARYYSPLFGRFLSVDPVAGSPLAPQSWNRFAYARNNPVRLVDPDGREVAVAAISADLGLPLPLQWVARKADERFDPTRTNGASEDHGYVDPKALELDLSVELGVAADHEGDVGLIFRLGASQSQSVGLGIGEVTAKGGIQFDVTVDSMAGESVSVRADLPGLGADVTLPNDKGEGAGASAVLQLRPGVGTAAAEQTTFVLNAGKGARFALPQLQLAYLGARAARKLKRFIEKRLDGAPPIALSDE